MTHRPKHRQHRQHRHSDANSTASVGRELNPAASFVRSTSAPGDNTGGGGLWAWAGVHKWWMVMGLILIGGFLLLLRRMRNTSTTSTSDSSTPPHGAVATAVPADKKAPASLMQRLGSIALGFLGGDAPVVSEVYQLAQECSELSTMDTRVKTGAASIVAANKLHDSILTQLKIDAEAGNKDMCLSEMTVSPETHNVVSDANHTHDVKSQAGDPVTIDVYLDIANTPKDGKHRDVNKDSTKSPTVPAKSESTTECEPLMDVECVIDADQLVTISNPECQKSPTVTSTEHDTAIRTWMDTTELAIPLSAAQRTDTVSVAPSVQTCEKKSVVPSIASGVSDIVFIQPRANKTSRATNGGGGGAQRKTAKQSRKAKKCVVR